MRAIERQIAIAPEDEQAALRTLLAAYERTLAATRLAAQGVGRS